MKRKIIAIIACILVAGTAGVSAKTITATNAPSAVANTVSTSASAAVNKNTNANCPLTTNAQVQAVTKNCPTTTNAAANSAVAAVPVTGKNSSCNSAVNCQSAANCPVNAQNCATGNCLTNTLNCSDGTCIANILNCNSNSCLKNALNCTNGSYVKIISNCKNNSTAVPATPSKPSTSTTPSSTPSTSSKPSTSTTPSATPSTTPSTTSQSGSSYASFQNQVIQLVNEQRTANGLKPLTANAPLTNTATLKSQDMAKLNYFDHTSPTYGSPFDMMKKYGITYRAAGENIAMGQTTPAQVMQGWMNSPGHRANILNASFTQIGVGIAKNAQGQLIWTQQFIG